MCELLAGALTGGGSSHPRSPSAWRLVNNMLTIAVDPAALGAAEAFGLDVARLEAWVKSARPAAPGAEILLPGEIEARTRAQRAAQGIPMDVTTRAQLSAAARRLGVAVPAELADG